MASREGSWCRQGPRAGSAPFGASLASSRPRRRGRAQSPPGVYALCSHSTPISSGSLVRGYAGFTRQRQSEWPMSHTLVHNPPERWEAGSSVECCAWRELAGDMREVLFGINSSNTQRVSSLGLDAAPRPTKALPRSASFFGARPGRAGWRGGRREAGGLTGARD